MQACQVWAGVLWVKTAGLQEEGLGDICVQLITLLQRVPQLCGTTSCTCRRQRISAKLLEALLGCVLICTVSEAPAKAFRGVQCVS